MPAVEEDTSSPPADPVGVPAGSPKDYALSKVGAAQFECLDLLWQKESEWRATAQNDTSSAYGIPQLLDQTWIDVGYTKTSDPFVQVDAGLAYIDARYGSPCAAWEHSELEGWY